MAADGEYVRWVNSKEPGALMFVTTTTLGYTPVFRSPGEKEHLIALLAEACRLHGALLHAYCVMDHHLHLVIRAPTHMTMSKFMQSFKRHSTASFLRRVSSKDRCRLQLASKDNHGFWMRSFRGIPIRSEKVMRACVRYIHLNPVRAGLCDDPCDYQWSSARLFEEFMWTEDEGVLPCLP